MLDTWTGARGRATRCVARETRPVHVVAVALSVAVAVGLAACGGGRGASAEAVPSGAIAVVVGARSNMPPPALGGRSASARDMAIAQGAQFSLFVADGAPFQAGTTIPLGRDQGRSDVEDAIAAARARTPESDLLGALHLAARELAGRRGLRTLVVIDSGLSTTGRLDFTTPGLLDAQPRELADTLRDAEELPDLSGVTVVFRGLGDTAAPQQQLDQVRRAQLVEIWSAIARQAGATNVDVDTARLEGAADPTVPAVATVAPGPGFQCAGTTMSLTGGPFAFRPDSHEFIDAQAAVAALRPVADQLRSEQITATVFGHTAGIGEMANRIRFSDERAQAVADVLIDLQVPIPQLHVEGLGSEFPGFVADYDGSGRLLPAAAALNRSVFVEFSAPVTCG